MGSECKKARNTVLIPLIILIAILIFCSSCGTWKWVEPMTPDSANNHRFNNSICK